MKKPVYTKYIDSPLGRLLDALLQKMEDQLTRHPLSADSSVELKYFHKMSLACQDILGRVHRAIESNFCSGGEPGVLGILGIIKDGSLLFYRYKDYVYSREEVFCKELEAHLGNVIKTAASMQGDKSTNVVKILEKNQNTFFAKTLEMPGVDISVYFQAIKAKLYREEVFCNELKEHLADVIKSAVSMRGNLCANMLRILRANQRTYFPRTLDIPGISLEVYFQEFRVRISEIDAEKAALPIDLEGLLDSVKIDFRSEGNRIPDINHYRNSAKFAYELVELVLMHYNAFPRELHQILPYFNPDSLTLDLHNSYYAGVGPLALPIPVGSIIRGIFGQSFKIEHVKQSKDSKSKFRYQLLSYTSKEVATDNASQNAPPAEVQNSQVDSAHYDIETQEFDAEPHFKEYFEHPLMGLLLGMNLYFQTCLLNQNVQVLLDEDVLCQSLLRESTRQIQNFLPSVIGFDQHYLTKAKSLKGLEQILALDRALAALQEFKAAFERLEKFIELPGEHIRSVYHAVTKEPIRNTELVPVKLLERIKGVGIPYVIPLYHCSMTEIDLKVTDNRNKYSDNQYLIDQLQGQLNEAVSRYKKDKNLVCCKELQVYHQELKKILEKYKIALKGIHFEVGVLSKDLQSLQLDFDQVNQEHASILAFHESVGALINRVTESSAVDPLFKKFDKDNKFQNELSELAKEMAGNLEIFHKDLADILAQIIARKKIIEKAYSEAKFLEQMRASNPEQMRQLVVERRSETTRLGCAIEEHKRQLSDTRQYNGLVQEVIGFVSKHKEVDGDLITRLQNDKEFTLLWIVDQKVYLETLFSKIEDNKVFPGHYKDLINKLEFVKRCLHVSISYIQFEKIDNLLCFKSDDDVAPCGFDKCLSIIEMADGSIAKIKEFRSRQESLFWPNPSDQEFNETRSFLNAMVCKKIDDFQKLIADGDHIKTAVPRLTEINAHIRAIDLKGNERSLLDKISEVSLEKEKMQDSVPVLEKFIEIQILIKQFVERIEEFNGEGDFINNWNLYRKSPKLYDEQDKLETLAEEFLETIRVSKFPQENKQYSRVVTFLLDATRSRISDIIRYKFESTLRDYDNKLKELQDKCGPLQTELEELSKPLELNDNETPESGYKKTLDHHLAVDRVSKIQNLLERHDLLIRFITRTLGELDASAEDTAFLRGDYSEQIKLKRSALLLIKATLEPVGISLAHVRRMSLSASLFRSLDRYLLERSERYYVKDIFYDSDKIERSIFINQLRIELNKFNTSGDVSPIIDFIGKNMSRFPGAHFRAVMSRTICTLMDYDDQWDTVGNKKISNYDVFPDESARRGEIQGILQSLLTSESEAHKAYARKVKYMYGRIQEMKEYSDTLPPRYSFNVGNLAKRLQKTVDQFVMSRPENDPKAFEKFQIRLTAVVHSKDNVLSELGYSFGRFLINIIVALASLCAQPICYKITTGRFGFLAKNYVEESLNRVTRTIDEFTPTMLSVTG
ncbi:MAG: hypothetical protein K2X50_04250 [Gammaproteobacteria bacterium]|nr:hypothetical protein [Gammaproteobacteria bacterium]